LETAVENALEISGCNSQEKVLKPPVVNEDAIIRERRSLLRRSIFWWLFSRSSVLLSLMAVAKFALVFKTRVIGSRWLENPYAFDSRNLRGIQF
jgi:hypothetical protein